MGKTSLALFLCLGVIANTQRTPTITFVSPDIVADIGDDVEITCSISDGQEYPLLWMRISEKGPSFPISTGPNLLINDKRFSLEHDMKTGSYSLSIRGIQPTDSATYQCQVVVTLQNMVTADVKVQAKMPPVMSEDASTRRSTAVVGESALLTCGASGFPIPRITWSREDGRVLPSGQEETTVQTLGINNVRKEDRGEYVCTANNGVGKSQHRTVYLEVEFPPTIDVPRPKIPQAVGYDARMSCNINAFPPPAIFWKKDNDVITNSDNYQISHFASQDEATTSTLTIHEAREDQFGKYRCEASNRHGSASQHLELYRSKTPICPPVCGDVDMKNGAASNVVLHFPIGWTLFFFAILHFFRM